MSQSFDRAVVEVSLAHDEAAVGEQRVADDLDLVVLRRDLDATRREILHGMVGAVMTQPKAIRLPAGPARADLVPEADSQQGATVVDHRACHLDRSAETCRV